MDGDEEDYRVGYGRPPKHGRIKKGECRNPNGRRGKKAKPAPVMETEAEILKRLDEETVEYQGRQITKREAQMRALQAKALKGDFAAMKLKDKYLEQMRQQENKPGGGVLLIPHMEFEEWQAAAYAQQAQYREQTPETIARQEEELARLTNRKKNDTGE